MTPACAEQTLLLSGFIDGELDAANTVQVETHLGQCSGCRDELERLQATREFLSGEGMRHRAPAALRQRVLKMPELAVRGAVQPRRVPAWLVSGVGGALAASLAMVLLIQPTPDAAIDRDLVSSHVRSLQVGHLTDVQTSNEHVVRPWFNGKIDFAPPVPELADAGFPLAGGRLDYVGSRNVAAIVYRRRLHSVNLFVWRAPAQPAHRSAADGFSIDEWSENGLRFAAVSDIGPAELDQFRRLFSQRSQAPVVR
ncbi:MAG: anti-sigma factor [Sphingomonadales bacterium]|nr:anti-sigma factor [Sphingomonadales bacterium]